MSVAVSGRLLADSVVLTPAWFIASTVCLRSLQLLEVKLGLEVKLSADHCTVRSKNLLQSYSQSFSATGLLAVRAPISVIKRHKPIDCKIMKLMSQVTKAAQSARLFTDGHH